MNISTRHSRRSRFALRAALVLAAFVGLFLASGVGSPASAYTTVGTGYYGAVTPYKVAGIATYVGTGGFNPVPGIQAGNAVVGRSAATSGAQQVDIQVHIYQAVNGRWQILSSRWQPARIIRAGQSSVSVVTSNTLTGVSRLNGHYRVIMNVYWRDANTLAMLGSRAIDMAHASDYGCQVFGNVRCATGPGYITLW
jgi:hypothetical protein